MAESYSVYYDGDAPKGQQWIIAASTVGLDGSTRKLSAHPTKKAAKAAARSMMRPGDGGVAYTKGMGSSEPL